MNKLLKKIKLNKIVCVITGKFKKQTGKITKIDRKNNLVCIEGINEKTRFKKKLEPSTQKMVKVMFKSPGTIHISNIKIVENE